MARQSQKSEQITQTLSVKLDYDDTMRGNKAFEEAFEEALGHIEVIKYDSHRVYKYTHDNHDTYFLTGAITWLNKPHPLFKKRLQLKNWYKDVYDEFNSRENSDVRIVGVYRYDGMHIFVEFHIDDYMENKLNNSSAHVYTNDLYQALVKDYFTKEDQNGNLITTISSKNFKKYIDGEFNENNEFKMFVKPYADDNINEENIFEMFINSNEIFSFGEWITAESAIEEMKSGKWYQWKGTEWAGWFLEYAMNEFIEKKHCQDLMEYIGNKKTNDMLDFDLFFENDDFYGDLKASDIDKKELILNDQINVIKAINQKGKLWYVIFEHETKKDTDFGNEMAIRRMELMGKEYVEGSEISYASRMKHSVNFKKMEVLELNKINMHEILDDFNQGHNSDGNARKPKFKINKKNIDNFIIYSYKANQN